jgi:hypothetical protein
MRDVSFMVGDVEIKYGLRHYTARLAFSPVAESIIGGSEKLYDHEMRQTVYNMLAEIATRPIKSIKYPATFKDHLKVEIASRFPWAAKYLGEPRYVEVSMEGWMDLLHPNIESSRWTLVRPSDVAEYEVPSDSSLWR